MINLAQEMRDNDVVVIVCGEDYKQRLIEAIKEAEKQYKAICYVTSNQSYLNLTKLFKKNTGK